jgi:hypothetical protein
MREWEGVMRQLVIIIIFFFSLFTALPSIAAEEAAIGDIDATLEPILASEWVCYIQKGDLFVKNPSSAPLKVRDAKAQLSSIFAPQMVFVDGMPVVLRVERGAGENRLLVAKIEPAKKEGNVQVIVLDISQDEIRGWLAADSKAGIYVISVKREGSLQMAAHVSKDTAKTFQKVPVAVTGLEAVNIIKPLVQGNILYMFCHAILEGRSRLGVYIVDFDNDIKQSYTLLKMPQPYLS